MPDLNKLPVTLNLPDMPRGDFREYEVLCKGVCWTAEEPGDPLPEGIVWQERYWWSEARRGLASAMRYHNGWIPWYGNPPSTYVWWVKYSLGAIFMCSSRWDSELEGTVVTVRIDSENSWKVRASLYNWSLRSGAVKERVDPEDALSAPKYFHQFVTWAKGKWRVIEGDTVYAPVPAEAAP